MQGYAEALPELARELQARLRGELSDDWDADIPEFPADAKGVANSTASARFGKRPHWPPRL